ncbi:hypothetical protein KAFR_0C06210 [Kazachstania africana CBS 2517]|uniref:Dihydrolipoamide dehydrogenase-binding protein of pyruvate dehydrogenase complex n=1 Tax=Kazachstania africana (strain ATCC 22294 / BCRC 22015 / CBS 2517 / CECT 1963 / NBRC 1671 / NRRL Y-8276) TaxID=1071382 RepID=H2ATB3_KAZAF|nr:hypothetical protein KAFR_0C06210 [Kazachstania africana CBS 2517]CCF57613.1 hypothetical protein KAFR_0C06210 [Kazachstania africana CBS 2517]
MLGINLVRTAARLVLKRNSARCLHNSAKVWDIQPFLMPAMSPTMEKGGIVSWKVEVGNTFSAGDVLLEVETDKAQIDVEAQDDGKLAKILRKDGSKDISVGETIAFIAEPNDDLSTLEIPEIAQDKREKAHASSGKKDELQAKSSPQATPTKGAKRSAVKLHTANPNQTLLPSVSLLLAENNLSKEDAFNNIEATGLNGRLLKGDVLAYLGRIDNENLLGITEYIRNSESLDLSNIKVKPRQAMETQEISKEKVEETKKEAAIKKAPLILNEEIILTVPSEVNELKLSKSLRSFIDEAYHYTHRASLENEQSNYFDAIFDELTTPNLRAPRFKYSYDIIPLNTNSNNMMGEEDDIFDILSSRKRRASVESRRNNEKTNDYLLNLRVAVSNRFLDSEKKASRFIEYIKQVEIF